MTVLFARLACVRAVNITGGASIIGFEQSAVRIVHS